jgi:glucose dehydrogenase
MSFQLQIWSSRWSVAIQRCAIGLLCCAFAVEPLLAQEADWPYNGGDVWNRRFQSIDQITPANVNQLAKAWVFNTGTNPGDQDIEEVPIEVNGVVYTSDGLMNVFALNAATGKQIWKYTPSPAVTTTSGYNTGNRGVVYGMGLIFAAQHGGNLVALNAKTGALVWQVNTGGAPTHTFLSTAPQFIGASEGKVPEVITGTSSDSAGICSVNAYNPATGKLLWQFYTQEPNTWAGDSAKFGSGAVFDTPTFDPTRLMTVRSARERTCTPRAW